MLLSELIKTIPYLRSGLMSLPFRVAACMPKDRGLPLNSLQTIGEPPRQRLSHLLPAQNYAPTS